MLSRSSRSAQLGKKHLFQLERWRHFKLIVSALVRRLVGPPSLKHRRVAEAIALHVVVLHLAHTLGSHRFPREILAGAPSAVATWQTSRSVGGHICPLAPWVSFERSLA